MTYYEAFSEARKALNSEEKTGSVGENIILQDNFDMKAWSICSFFLAPLTMTDEQMEKGLEIFEEALKEALNA